MKSLVDQDELESAVSISLRAKARSEGQYGYWADLLGPVGCGSLLWTMEREYLSPGSEAKARELALYALRHLKDLGFVRSIEVDAKRSDEKMNINVILDGGDQDVRV